MEILIRNLQDNQQSLEDALRLETTPDEIKETNYGKKLLRHVRSRHRIIQQAIKILGKA